MNPFPPPHSPDTTPPEPVTALARRVSRRGLLIGVASAAAVSTTGIAVLYAARQTSRSTLAARTSIDRPPAVTTPATTGTTATTATTTTTATTATTTTTTTTTSPGPIVAETDRVLVVLQLSGGNDALDTVVPLVGAYHDARPHLALADESLVRLPFGTDYGLHPALAPLGALLTAGQIGIVAGVGFDQPDRSHFKALDMWWSAAPGETFRTGWLGRWLDATTSNDDAVLRSVGLGGSVPALRADTAQSIGVTEVEQFSVSSSSTDAALVTAWSMLSPEHAAALEATYTFAGFPTVGAGTPGEEPGSRPTGAGDVTTRLRTAAQLIAAEPRTRVVHVTVGGFDTHAGEAATHQRLLADVAQGITEFQSAIEASGNAGRTLLVTTSEFGRRVVENGSGGTDHGKAGVQFVIGQGLTSAAFTGAMDLSDLADGDLRPVIDPRSIYASALDWLEGGSASGVTDAVLGGPFERLPFFS